MFNPSPLWIRILTLLYCTLSLCTTSYAQKNWQILAPGIRYLDLNSDTFSPWSHIHVFEINLRYHQIKLAFAKDVHKSLASVNQLAQKEQALLAINGGFFDKHHQPLGMRTSEGNRIQAAKKISWWGIFYIRRDRAFLASPKQYIPYKGVDFALQSGPRLIINRSIPSLKPGKAQRTALGINANGSKIYIVVTENAAMTTKALARKMLAPPLNCANALNLDGGSSTQLVARLPDFRLNVHGLSNVSDAVLVMPK